MPPFFSSFIALLKRDLLLAFRCRSESFASILFFILCASLFPLALGPSPSFLHHMGPGILWVCALLAALLPIEKLFSAELEDGSLEILLLTLPSPLLLAVSKITSHWLITALPILLASLPLAIMFTLTQTEFILLIFSLFLGSLTLSLLGGMISALLLGARHGAVLVPLLILPLYSPVLIFGASASYSVQLDINPTSSLELLGAFFLCALALCPLATSWGLKEACH